MKPIKRIAAELGIAEIRLWILIRKGVIASCADLNTVYVYESEINNYFARYPQQLEYFQQQYRSRQESISKQ